MAKELGRSPSGQDVIDFISDVNSTYPNAFVTGKTLQSSVPGITDDAQKSLGKIKQITKSGNLMTVSGATQIEILKNVLNLKITDKATFNISELTSKKAVIDVTGIKVGWFNFNQVIIDPTSITINVGGMNTTWNLK